MIVVDYLRRKTPIPNYHYQCRDCQHEFETHQSIKDDSLINCPSCLADSLQRVIHSANVFVKGEPVTVAQQADRNMAKMGKYELEAKRHDHAEAAKKAGAGKRPKAERPFWRKTDKINTDLAKLAPDVTIEKGKITKSEPLSPKAVDYIMTGKQ